MIYDFPSPNQPIRQGDIFFNLPRIDLSLQEMPIVTDDGNRVVTWREVSQNDIPITALLAIRPVKAIVVSQDCDTLRAPDITLCEIRRFQDIERKSAQASSPKAWKNLLTQQARLNQKWYYLPPDDRIGFTHKHAVDFLVTLRIPRRDLEALREFRRGRLNDTADEHFRERIAEFFRRYPYDEWYALDQAELDAYLQEYPEAEPFPWQLRPASERES